MLELLALLFALGLLAVVAVPAILVLGGLVLAAKLALALILIPVQILGWALGGLMHGAGIVLGSALKFLAVLAVLTILLLVGLGLVALPLLPVLLAVAAGWIVYRLSRGPRPAAAQTATSGS